MSREFLASWQHSHAKPDEPLQLDRTAFDLATAYHVAQTNLADEIIMLIHAQPPVFF